MSEYTNVHAHWGRERGGEQILAEITIIPGTTTRRRPGAKLRLTTVELTICGDTVMVDDRAEYPMSRKRGNPQHATTQSTGCQPPAPKPPKPQRLVSLSPANEQGAYLISLQDKDESATTTLLVLPLSKRDGDELARLSATRSGALGQTAAAVDEFSKRIDQNSSELYFHYYGMFPHQANMLQDHIRTGTYFAALMENASDFKDKAVLDVGSGSGILSFFAAQAGARVVYAVEASEFANYSKLLVKSNPELGAKIKVIKGRMEEVELPEKVDVIVSEPMGTLLVNERMLETYIYARKHHLAPGGKMFPTNGTIFCAAFSDEMLWNEVSSKSSFWMNSGFYGINLGALAAHARNASFAQPVIDQIPPEVLVSNSNVQTFDFGTLDESDLVDFDITLSLHVSRSCVVHGIATWFDVAFVGSTAQRILSTSPGVPLTHWYQLRCVLQNPIRVSAGETVRGVMRFKAHARQAYDIGLEMWSANGERSCGSYDLKEPYYRQLVASYDMGMLGGDAGGCLGVVERTSRDESSGSGWRSGEPSAGSEELNPVSTGEHTWWV